jgi:hypothetical protein
MQDKYDDLFHDIFDKAASKNPFGVVCTILRVGGMQDANWDSFEESREAIDDYNWILEKTASERNSKANIRIALLMYCQLTEISALHDMLTNLLRIIKGDAYNLYPLKHLGKSIKTKKGYKYIPPSAKVKFNSIKDLARSLGENELSKAIDIMYSDKIRNAFSHSDYIITEEGLRFTESGYPEQIAINEMQTIIKECFNFYSSFLRIHKLWLIELSKKNRFHTWPNYEVLELLSDEDGLYGFSLHFSNGNKATYERKKEGVKSTNIILEPDGINYMIGSIDDLENNWKVNGEIVDDIDRLNKNRS